MGIIKLRHVHHGFTELLLGRDVFKEVVKLIGCVGIADKDCQITQGFTAQVVTIGWHFAITKRWI
ncbi:hypothetical protein D3C86_1973250 [compost metagenome]